MINAESWHSSVPTYDTHLPTQVLVNGEPVLTATGQGSGGLIHHSGAAAAPALLPGPAGGPTSGAIVAAAGKHSAGNVTGLTASDFLALPANAQVSMVVHGDGANQAEGFLMLRKV